MHTKTVLVSALAALIATTAAAPTSGISRKSETAGSEAGMAQIKQAAAPAAGNGGHDHGDIANLLGGLTGGGEEGNVAVGQVRATAAGKGKGKGKGGIARALAGLAGAAGGAGGAGGGNPLAGLLGGAGGGAGGDPLTAILGGLGGAGGGAGGNPLAGLLGGAGGAGGANPLAGLLGGAGGGAGGNPLGGLLGALGKRDLAAAVGGDVVGEEVEFESDD